MGLRENKPDYLRRLPADWYRGFAWVHWTMTMEGRKSGWLDDGMHSRVREFLLHALTRNQLVCPVYCLMPDHAHFLWMGLAEGSNQLMSATFFRRFWNQLLCEEGFKLQKQSHDHVLEESERNPEAFEDTCIYILKNPERAKLVDEWREWTFLGSLAPGYPDLDPRDGDWQERFWTIHNKELQR